MRALGFVWIVATNLFYLAVVWFVLDHVRERPESVLLPILGILYVAIRLVGVGVAGSIAAIGKALDEIERRVAAGPAYVADPEQMAERRKREDQLQVRMLVNMFFLGLISLLCTWKFFVAIGAI